MKIEFDFSELYDFADRLNDTYNFETNLMTATQNIARVLHNNLLEQTPIVTGNLRKMWSAGDNLLFTVEKTNGGYEVTLINTARRDSEDGFMYGTAVNDGHRTPGGSGWVMGRFFVENSIDLTYPKVQKIVMAELKKWWSGV